jgi:hypothetical protein
MESECHCIRNNGKWELGWSGRANFFASTKANTTRPLGFNTEGTETQSTQRNQRHTQPPNSSGVSSVHSSQTDIYLFYRTSKVSELGTQGNPALRRPRDDRFERRWLPGRRTQIRLLTLPDAWQHRKGVRRAYNFGEPAFLDALFNSLALRASSPFWK